MARVSPWTRINLFILLSTVATTALQCSTYKGSCPSEGRNIVGEESIRKIQYGGVAIEHNWLEPALVDAMRDDAKHLFRKGLFSPDGLTNTALTKKQQGFTSGDRQTFKGDGWYDSSLGNVEAREEFARIMRELRVELATKLDRPTLATEGIRKHEMTYNWYEPGAKLGRHLDEHHEETKGVKGWTVPTRRSVTWLLYLNNDWLPEEGGALHTFPRKEPSMTSVGSHDGNLQVGWLDHTVPVFLDSWRASGQNALYVLTSQSKKEGERSYLSPVDFDVPSQPIDFSQFLPISSRSRFEQISTPRLDSRFSSSSSSNNNNNQAQQTMYGQVDAQMSGEHALDVVPQAGTLVLFDSVTVPHLVQEITSSRQRIAATGWFHEDSQQLMM